ncbi:MAG: sugar ABC transporter permease [Nitrososphaeria archaeon]
MRKLNPFLFFSLLPAFAFILFFGIYPFLYACFYSTRQYYLGLNVPEIFTGMSNYYNSAHDPLFLYSLGLTCLFVVCAVGVELLLGLGVAILFSVIKTKGYNYLQVLLSFPLMMPPVVTGFLFWLIFNTDLGIANHYLSLIGLIPRNYNILANFWSAFSAIVLGDVWMWTPFFIIVLYSAIQSLPLEMIESATVDGCLSKHLVKYIIIPKIKPAILVTLLIRVIDAFRTYDLVYVLTGGGPGTSTQVLSLEIYFQGFRYWFMGKAFAQALILTAILILIGNILIYLIRRGAE